MEGPDVRNCPKTTTCKCGKIDVPVVENRSVCASCGWITHNPKLDEFPSSQKTLTDFYSSTRNKVQVARTLATPKRWKQLRIDFAELNAPQIDTAHLPR